MPLVPTDGTLLTLDQISGLVSVDNDGLATVKAGMRLDALGPALQAHGRAMNNLPDINVQSFAGAISTATHGTGKRLQALHGNVTALRLVTAKGDILDCSATSNPDLFDAARVSLGSMGIITQVTTKTEPAKHVHRRVWLDTFEDTLTKAEDNWNKHRNFEFYAIPFTGLCANIANDPTDRPVEPRGPETDSEFLEVLKYLRNLFAMFRGDEFKAVAAYNGGEHAVEQWTRKFPGADDEWVENITYRETREYVKKVIGGWREYQLLYGQKSRLSMLRRTPQSPE